MKKLKRSIVDWLTDNDHHVAKLDYRRLSNARFGQEFRLIKAENGWVLESHDMQTDTSRIWLVPEGQTPGQMVDVVLVEERLK